MALINFLNQIQVKLGSVWKNPAGMAYSHGHFDYPGMFPYNSSLFSMLDTYAGGGDPEAGSNINSIFFGVNF